MRVTESLPMQPIMPYCKAYDIRGKVPSELSYELAYNIGRSFAKTIDPHTVVVGYDIRLESPDFASHVIKGLNDEGVNVINIGLCGTEEVYFHTVNEQAQKVGGGIMITASHNPKGYNGMKLVRHNSIPISGDSGLVEICKQAVDIQNLNVTPSVLEGGTPGWTLSQDDKTNYISHLLSYVNTECLKPLKIVVNPGNGSAGVVLKLLEKHLPFEFIYVNDEPDGNFPNGVPNPLLPENRSLTSKAVKLHKADMGIAWDGDFDRCFLFCENGEFIEGYYIVGLLADAFLKKHPNEKIIHDARLLWNTLDIVHDVGGHPIQSKAGHTFMKERMRAENAIYGGEMSAHHYFRDFAYFDSGMVPWLLVAELMSLTGRPLSQKVAERLKAYPCSGELNYTVKDAGAVSEAIFKHFSPMDPVVDYTDGLSLAFPDWRFNLRASNTEPLLRLNVETRANQSLLKERVAEIEGLIKLQSNGS
jgi:phosphomannomutase/phosphoglucomutase